MLEVFFNYFLFIYILIYFVNINIASVLFNFQITKKIVLYKALLVGFSLNLVILSLFYLIFKIKIQYIFFLLIFLSTIFFIINLYINRKFYKIILQPLLPILFFSILFSFIAHSQGLQYYVFRGNYWDYFNYIASSLMIYKYDFNFLINNENLLHTQNIFSKMGWLFHLEIRPTINIFFSQFYNLKLQNFFLTNFTIKTISFLYLFSVFYIFFYDLQLKFLKNKNTLFSLLLCLSFWPIYIFEIDSLVQLFSLSLLIFCFYYLLNIEKIFIKKNKFLLVQFFIVNFSLFLIYPEIFLIYLVVCFFYLILSGKKIFNLFRLYKIKILILSLTFIFLTSLFYQTHYHYLLLALEIGTSQSFELAGYFGSFILGKNSLVLNEIFVENLKQIIINKQSFASIVEYVHKGLISNGFNFYYLNLLPSIFGFYEYTLGKADLKNQFYQIFFLLILNIFIIFYTAKNIRYIYFKHNNFSILIKAVLVTFFSLSIFFLFNSAIWSVIKLYFYFSFFIILLIVLIFKKDNISLNYPSFILIIIFPLYFYTGINDGIGRINSFPSIIDRQMKESFSWKIDYEELKKCDSILISTDNIIKEKYLTLVMVRENIKIIVGDLNDSNTCKILTKNSGFYLN